MTEAARMAAFFFNRAAVAAASRVEPECDMKRLPRLALAVPPVAALILFTACSGTPEEHARWYLKDKPADMRVPVSGTADPAQGIADDPAMKE